MRCEEGCGFWVGLAAVGGVEAGEGDVDLGCDCGVFFGEGGCR